MAICLGIYPIFRQTHILSQIIQNLALSHATLTGTESEHLSRCQSEISSYFDEISLEVMNIIALPPSQKDNIATALTLTVPCPYPVVAASHCSGTSKAEIGIEIAETLGETLPDASYGRCHFSIMNQQKNIVPS